MSSLRTRSIVRKEVNVDVPAERPMRWLVLSLVALLAYTVWPAAGAIVVGGFTALVAWRPYQWLLRHLGCHRLLVSVLVTLALAILILAPVAFILYLSVHEALIALEWLRQQELMKLVGNFPPFLRSAAHKYLGGAAHLASAVAGHIPYVLGGVGRWLIEAFLALVTLFYALWRGPQMIEFLRRTSPLSADHTNALLDEFHIVARGLFWGNVVIAVFHGVFGAIGYWIARVPAVLFLGGITLFASFIPGIGTAVVWIPIAVVMWILGHHWNALFLLSWGVVVIGGIDHLLRPALSRVGTSLPTLLMFLTIYGGIATFGLKGLLLGPMFGGLAVAALRMIARRPPEIISTA